MTGEVIRSSRATAVRYERSRPGELVHMDVKKLARIPDGGGWRAHGRAATVDHRHKSVPTGFDYVHSLVDDHSRLACSEILPDEKGTTCAAFLARAAAYFAAHGIDRIERVMTDNACAYKYSLRDVCASLGARQKFGPRVLRRAVEWAAASLDLTELVRAHVDLDALAAVIDVDAVVARADVDAVVARVDVDAVVARMDLDAALETIDFDAVVTRVDLDAILARVHLDAVVAGLDVDRVASRLDLDAILARVDPDVVIARVHLEAVLARLDLAEITRGVIDAIDLPKVLRQSTGAVSSQAARIVRAEGMNADESVARFVDRVLRRPHPRGAVT